MKSCRVLRLIAVVALCPWWVAATAQADIPIERQQAVRHLLLQDCGSCHGLTLQGGLGPALTRSALAGRSPESLRDVILNGRPGTPMPPWKPFLTEAEAAWLVDLLLHGEMADAR